MESASYLRVKQAHPQATIVGRPAWQRSWPRARYVSRWTTLYLHGYNVSMRSDAIPDATSIHGSAAASGDRLLDRLIDSFNRQPEVVRGEASVVIAALS